MNYDIAIVVLNYKKWGLTKNCVDSFISLDIQAHIVIVDNNSCDDSIEILNNYFSDKPNVVVIPNNINNGYASGNNVGFKYILEHYPMVKYMVVSNPDVEIKDGSILEKLKQTLITDTSIAIISPVMVMNGVVDYSLCAWKLPTKSSLIFNHMVIREKRVRESCVDLKSLINYVDVVPGSFFMVEKDFLTSIGLLDEGTFLFNEENILAIQAKKKMKRCAIRTDCFYYHNHQVTNKSKPLSNVLSGYIIGNKSREYLAKKYYSFFCYVLVKLISIINIPVIILRHWCGNLKRIVIVGNKNEL